MKILFVSHRFPYPPHGGAKVRAFNIIKHLSARHEVSVISLVRSEAEAAEAVGVSAHCHTFEAVRVKESIQTLRTASRLATMTPSSFGYFYSGELAHRIKQLVARERFDLIVAHSSSVGPYVAGFAAVPKIMDFCDMDSQKWLDYARFKSFPKSAGYWLEGVKLQREEKRLAQRFDKCTVATAAELETLRGFGAENGDSFPNGVDVDYYSPGDGVYDPDTICFVGRMDYFPNEECMVNFCADVLPLVRNQRPNLKLLIVGAEPSQRVRDLASIAGVTVTGSVPDVRDYVRRSALSAAPLNIARGTQNKILESMALGTPVIASRVAAGGVDATPGEHLLVAQSPRQFADAIVQLMSDTHYRQRLSAAGRQRMLSHHTWDRAMQQFDAIVSACMLARQGRRGAARSTAQHPSTEPAVTARWSDHQG